jgi:hypothetical protein
MLQRDIEIAIERLQLNQRNHTSALLILAGLIENLNIRQQHMLEQYGDPQSEFAITDRTILAQLTTQLKQMKERNQ